MPFLFSKIENARDQLITGVLLVLAIAIMVNRHDGGMQNTRVLSMTVMSYLEQPLSMVRMYRTALQTNRELHRENIMLLDELSRLRSADARINELSNLLDFKSEDHIRQELIPTIIVGKNLTGLRNSITIDAGSKARVGIGMPLVNAQGLIGRVTLIGNDYAQVMPLLNTLFRASANIQGIRAYGIVSWEGSGNELVLNFVPQTVEVIPGMIIETSEYSNEFPPNIPIGKVVRTQPEPGRDTQRIYLEPFVDLTTIAEAFVIRYLPNPEVDSLITQYENLF
jgi:rod shape-determining protein MreC